MCLSVVILCALIFYKIHFKKVAILFKLFLVKVAVLLAYGSQMWRYLLEGGGLSDVAIISLFYLISRI